MDGSGGRGGKGYRAVEGQLGVCEPDRLGAGPPQSHTSAFLHVECATYLVFSSVTVPNWLSPFRHFPGRPRGMCMSMWPPTGRAQKPAHTRGHTIHRARSACGRARRRAPARSRASGVRASQCPLALRVCYLFECFVTSKVAQKGYVSRLCARGGWRTARAAGVGCCCSGCKIGALPLAIGKRGGISSL